MSWSDLLSPDIQNFLKSHEHDDVRNLGLKSPPDPSWPYPLVLDQIKSRQKARKKLPQWLEFDGPIIFPASDTIEQASSIATALYKAQIVKGKSFADLCAGAGADSYAFTQYFETGTLVECDETSAAILEHNFALFTDKAITVIPASAEDALEKLDNIDLAYIDPQRRDQTRKGKYKLEDCTPNVFELLPQLQQKSRYVMIKCSPMLDIDLGLKSLPNTQEIHVLETQGECKEILFILDMHSQTPDADDVPIICAQIGECGQTIHTLRFTRKDETATNPEYTEPKKYLYEPGPAFLKSGGFGYIAVKYGLQKLHPHTHLYTSNDLLPKFPGRGFKVIDIIPAQKKAVFFEKANLSVRNFPEEVATLKKRLKIKDGGDLYAFACTLWNERKVLIATEKTNL